MRRLLWFRPAARVLLGSFVLGQAAFLAAANFGALPVGAPGAVASLPPGLRDPARRVDAAVKILTRRWAELTDQWQSWSLFAPDVADYVPFVTVDLRWRDRPPRRLAALNEPADPRHFFRLGGFRFRRVESALEVSPEEGRDFRPSGAAWRTRLVEGVAGRQVSMIAYLRWRLDAFLRAHPDLPPPAEVVLSMHLFRIPAPPGPEPWDWEDLGVYPVARWRPGSAGLEVYDPRTDDFGDLPGRGG